MNLIINAHSISQDKNGLYSLNDLHKASGSEKRHQPSNFMANQETKELVAEIEQDGTTAYHTVQGGNTKTVKQGTYVCRELVYRYAMWISPKFSLMVVRAFDTLNTGAIPALQRHTISVEQQAQIRQAIARQSNRQHYQTIYSALHQKFNIPRYSELLASDFGTAMSFICDYQFGQAELYQVLVDSAAHLHDYAHLLKSFRGLPFIDDNSAKYMYERINKNYVSIVKLAQTLDLQNMNDKPMFESDRLNYYGGAALIYR